MYIVNELESGGVVEVDNRQGGERKDPLTRNLQSIIARCESLEMELAREKARGLVPEEMEAGSRRVGAVCELAETMLEREGDG